MLKIIKNSNTFEIILDVVLKGVRDSNLVSRIKTHKLDLVKEFEDYEESTIKGDGFKLSTYRFSKKENIDPLVLGSLRHS